MNRKDALAACRLAGYHNDQHQLVRTYTENRVSYAAALAAFRVGQQQKAAGMRCTCYSCTRGSGSPRPQPAMSAGSPVSVAAMRAGNHGRA